MRRGLAGFLILAAIFMSMAVLSALGSILWIHPVLAQISTLAPTTPLLEPTKPVILDYVICRSGVSEVIPYPLPDDPYEQAQQLVCYDTTRTATLSPPTTTAVTATIYPSPNPTGVAATLTRAATEATGYARTNTPTRTRTPTRTPTPSATETVTPSLTGTDTPTETASPTATETPTPTCSCTTPTDTPTGTPTPLPTDTETPTSSPTEPGPTDTPTPLPTYTPTPSQVPSSRVVVDDGSVALFDDLTEQPVWLNAARGQSLLFTDRSVGVNINDYLNCLASSTSWSTTPSYCRRDYTIPPDWKTWTADNYNAGIVPSRILFNPDPVLLSRTNWVNQVESGSYYYEVEKWFLETAVPANIQRDVFLMQFSYLTAAPNMHVSDFFINQPTKYDVYDYLAFMQAHPTKKFILSTSSLARNNGSIDSDEFNEHLRIFARDNNLSLFDMAAIESHTPEGQPCLSTDNHPVICPDYTTESDGGHLGSVSSGGLRIAKAFWVLMARLTGWQP